MPLNDAQNLAASTLEGPVLVVAGAGTGKTSTLVSRLVRLVESGVDSRSILLLTFTRRAAEEMIHRAEHQLGEKAGTISGGTFHAFANSTLRRFSEEIGLDRNFTLLDQADINEAVSIARADELAHMHRKKGFPRASTIANMLSKAVNKQQPLPQIIDQHYSHLMIYGSSIERIARRYTEFKLMNKSVDYDDLLVILAKLLEKKPSIRRRITNRYQYIMVDEYQDTNILQAEIARHLAGTAQNIMVVGDDAQSIYAFRGARHDNILDFKKEFEDTKVITLEENYRSTQPILDVSNAILSQMTRAFRKTLRTSRRGGDLPRLIQVSDSDGEARMVCAKICELRKSGVRLSDIAVLFRAGNNSYALELLLAHEGVPFVKYGGFKFAESAHIKDVLAHVAVAAGTANELAASRVLTLCPRVGRVSARKLYNEMGGHLNAMSLRAAKSVTPTIKKGVHELIDLLHDLETLELTPAEMLERVVEYYRPGMHERFDNWPKRERDLQQLVTICRKYTTVEEMLDGLTLDPPSRADDNGLLGEDPHDKLVLSTVHSAKGLEWDHVFIIQANDGTIPMCFTPHLSSEELDEERRLLYVALTRAKDTLTITYLRYPERPGGDGDLSRFLRAVPPEYFDRPAGRRPAPPPRQTNDWRDRELTDITFWD
jgi:DNA helicase-2/ATP-dependent DNA helicase PcrA